jgi:hypothetical protein
MLNFYLKQVSPLSNYIYNLINTVNVLCLNRKSHFGGGRASYLAGGRASAISSAVSDDGSFDDNQDTLEEETSPPQE